MLPCTDNCSYCHFATTEESECAHSLIGDQHCYSSLSLSVSPLSSNAHRAEEKYDTNALSFLRRVQPRVTRARLVLDV